MSHPDDPSGPLSPNGAHHPEPAEAGNDHSGPLSPAGDASPLPFTDLRVPTPTPAPPPTAARWLAFSSILVGGLLGALIGYGTGDLMSGSSAGWAAVGLLVGALAGAIGVGIVAGLTLRAMSEWRATPHPEAPDKPGRFVLRRASTTTGEVRRPGDRRG